MGKATTHDHQAVSAAIAAAEARTDGEILTILADASDNYRDAAIQYAVLAALAVPVALAVIPARWLDWLTGLVRGWDQEWSVAGALLAMFIAQSLAFLLVRALLTYRPLLMAVTPAATKTRRVRRRAVTLFRASLERRTRGRTGILIYLSLAERRAEIVADAAITAKVDPEIWGEAMALLLAQVRAGRIGEGLALAAGAVGAVLAEHLPRSGDDSNEIPDKLIEL